MTDDRVLEQLLRSAFPPAPEPGPSRDRWPLVVKRIQARQPWSWFDVGLAAAVTFALLIFPEWLPLLMYHL